MVLSNFSRFPSILKRYSLVLFTFLSFSIFSSNEVIAQTCNCTEYIYLNEPRIGSVLKFEVDANGVPLTEVPAVDGTFPWYGGTELPFPHGAAFGPNGTLFIGSEAQTGAPIRKFSCDGTIQPIDAATIYNESTLTNMFSVEDILYVTTYGGPAAYNLCTGDSLGRVCYNDVNGMQIPFDNTSSGLWWGLDYNPEIDVVLSTITRAPWEAIYSYSLAELEAGIAEGTCIDPLIGYSAGTNYAALMLGDQFLPDSVVISGATSDNLGNIYVSGWTVVPGDTLGVGQEIKPGFVLKYDPAGNLLAKSALDVTSYNRSRGILWSSVNNQIYVANEVNMSTVDCISVFDDATLTYLGAGAPNPNLPVGDPAGKAMVLVKECCPTVANQTISHIVCLEEGLIGETIVIEELFPCEGVICEAPWVLQPGSNGITFDECLGEYTVGPGACATFIRSSDGTAANSQCGAFSVTLNIEVGAAPEARIYAIKSSCTDGIVGNDGYLELAEITTGDRVNWSVGSTYTGDPAYANAIDVSGATFPFVITSGLANPSVSQDYTVRVFDNTPSCNGGCTFTDYTVTLTEQNCISGCDCKEFIYLNETAGGGAIHKFEVLPDGTLDEVGSPWFNNTLAGETVTAPHGLGADYKGYLYVDETGFGDIRRFSCDGTITPASEFEIDTKWVLNMGSYENILYANAYIPGSEDNGIFAFDICTGAVLGYYCLNDIAPVVNRDWGLFVGPDGTIYVTDSTFDENEGPEENNVWRFNIADETLNAVNAPSPVCIDPILSSDDGIVSIGDSELPTEDIWGITPDMAGNMYIVMRDLGGTENAGIYKYSPSGTLLAVSTFDSVEGMPYPGFSEPNRGYSRAIGIVYSMVSDQLYVSSYSPDEDCVATFDTDLNYLGAAVPFTTEYSLSKGIAIRKECCPVNNMQQVTNNACDIAVGDKFFIQNIMECEGVICEGIWSEGAGNTGLTFDPCDVSVTINSSDACGTFILASDGMGTYSECGQFELTVEICKNAADCFDIMISRN